MESTSAAAILKTLEGLSTRMAVTAENIANANTPNYRPLQVTFENALAQAMQKDPAAVAAVRPKITERPIDPANPGVRLDLELTTDSTTAMRYSAVVELLNRELALRGLPLAPGA